MSRDIGDEIATLLAELRADLSEEDADELYGYARELGIDPKELEDER